MMADIYDCRIESLNFLEEATSMGAAVIGGVAAGVFKDFDVIHRFIAVDHVADAQPRNPKGVPQDDADPRESLPRRWSSVYEDLGCSHLTNRKSA